jgi:cob(I)alamin adenosyltransferase
VFHISYRINKEKMSEFNKGYIHIYTGDGKGKTTAAIGLAVRAAGSGVSSKIIQFLKGRHSGERESLKALNEFITIENFGCEKFIKDDFNSDEHKKIAQKGFSRVKDVIASGFSGVLVLDEIITAVNLKLIEESELVMLMETKPENIELVLTGRNANQNIIEKADLVTEMKCIKHYYNAGVKSRKGIEE